MDHGRLFSQAWSLLRQHKSLLWVGALAALGTEIFPILGRLFLSDLTLSNLNPDQIEKFLIIRLTDPAFLSWLLLILFIAFVGVWLIATLAEAALIVGVDSAASQKPFSLIQILRQGVSLLGRFIAIDTAIFFPLFVLLLLLLIVSSGSVIGLALTSNGVVDASTLSSVAIFLAACLLPLLCLLLPVTALSFLFRIFAFRAAAVDHQRMRPSIRQAWQITKRNATAVSILTLLVIAIRVGVTLLRASLTLPLSNLAAASNPAISATGVILTFAITFALATLAYTYLSVVWTLAYRQLNAQ